jgi:probable HAF family extracellular repeat protein
VSRTHTWFAACLSITTLSLFAHVVHAQQYSLIELGGPNPADGASAYGINDSDQVVGQISDSANGHYPGIWNGTSAMMLDLAGEVAGVAHDINNAGMVAGTTYAMLPDGSYEPHATRWIGGQATLLPTLGGAQGSAVSINQLGQIVGWTTDSGGWWHAVIWDDSTLTDLGIGMVRDINNVGQMIGRAAGLGPVLWNGTTATGLGIDIEPVAINDSGVIVGDMNTYDEDTGRWSIAASRWSAGTVVLLTGPTNFQRHTSVRDINNAGQVVGYAENNNLDTVATLWNGTTGLDLNTVLTPAQASHIKLYEATAINDLGYILVNGVDTVAHKGRSYVLVPQPSPDDL